MNQFTFYANKPSQNYNKVDIWLLGSIFLLWGLGIFTLYICSQNFAIRAFGDPVYFVKRQLLCSAVGFVLFAGFVITDMKYISFYYNGECFLVREGNKIFTCSFKINNNLNMELILGNLLQ